MFWQPPSGGCVLKLWLGRNREINGGQPPSGGCVLKPTACHPSPAPRSRAAAFGRLCVETSTETLGGGARKRQPPSGGCVLKRRPVHRRRPKPAQPPSGGCVLKLGYENGLRFFFRQPPSGGCVLKPTRLARAR